MTNHPLTDEDCYKLCNACGLDHAFDNMRRAADWQLEEVLDWLENNTDIFNSTCNTWFDGKEDLRRAMRPTTPTPQDNS